MALHPTIARVTDRIRERSAASRGIYLDRIGQAVSKGPVRGHLTCGNQAHAYAAMGPQKSALAAGRAPNIGIVTAYNDMLSAHQPYETYPSLMRAHAAEIGMVELRLAAAACGHCHQHMGRGIQADAVPARQFCQNSTAIFAQRSHAPPLPQCKRTGPGPCPAMPGSSSWAAAFQGVRRHLLPRGSVSALL